MLIERRSQISGKFNTMDLPVNEEQLIAYELSNLNIQDALPNLSPAQREFLLTGITPEEWDSIFPDEDEEWDNEE